MVVATTAPVQDVSTLLEAAHRPLMLFYARQARSQCPPVLVHNDKQDGAVPLTIADLQLRNTGRIELGGPDPQSRPPIQLQLTGKADPIAGQFTASAKVAPMAQEPSLIADLSTTGVQGDGLLKLSRLSSGPRSTAPR